MGKNRFSKVYSGSLLLLWGAIFMICAACQGRDKVDAINKAYFDAIGGKSKLAKIAFMTKSGEFLHFVGGDTIKGKYKLQVVYPDKIRISVITTAYSQIEIYNGDKGWRWDERQRRFVTLNEMERNVLRREAKMAGKELLFTDELYSRLKYGGTVEDKGMTFNRLIGFTPQRKMETLTFSAKSGLLTAWEKPDRMRNYYNYILVGGLFMPTRIDDYIAKRVTYRIYIKEIDLADPPPDAAFAEPGAADIPPASSQQ